MPHLRWSICPGLVIAAFAFGSSFKLASAADDVAVAPWKDAVAAWHLGDARDAAGANSALKPGGEVELGIALAGDERKASLERGGDGRAARFKGGWLDAGQGADGELNLSGEAMTMCLRLRDPSGQWNTSLFSKHGGHQHLVYNLFTVDLGAGMFLGFELGLAGRDDMVQVRLPLVLIDSKAWHDVIVRYDGRQLQLFVDGVLEDARPCAGRLREGNQEPALLAAESQGGKPIRPFRGLIDHAGLWNRALSDAEIVALSGGIQAVNERKAAQRARAAISDKLHEEGIAKAMASVAEARRVAEKDPRRPLYHFQAPALWMNDPNGPIQFRGEYHMFYQHNPYGDTWGHMHWGHAVSRDLVHWKHLPIALAPSLDRGEEHCFSGSAVINDGVPTIFYTSIGPRTPAGDGAVQWMATSHDGMLTWKKHADNPVMTDDLHGQLEIRDWRDPFVWREGNRWLMVVGGRKEGGRGCTFIYESENLTKWKFLNVLFEGQEANWECPNFFKLGDRWVLIYSPGGTVRYYTGQLNSDYTFAPAADGVIDYGDYYAPNSQVDDRGRRILWGWLTTVRGERWNGAMSLPRILTLLPDGHLQMEPAPELSQLRSKPQHFDSLVVGPDAALPDQVSQLSGDSLEIRAEIRPGDARVVGFDVRRSPDGSEATRIAYDRAFKQLRVADAVAPLELAADEPLRLQIFLDKCILEVYANGRRCVTKPLNPARADSLGVRPIAEGGSATFVSLDVWEMKSARLPSAEAR